MVAWLCCSTCFSERLFTWCRRKRKAAERRKKAQAAKERQWKNAGYSSLCIPLPATDDVEVVGIDGPSPAKPAAMRSVKCVSSLGCAPRLSAQSLGLHPH